MLNPFSRPFGSSQILRYRGQVLGGGPTATYPKANGTFPSDSVIDGSGLFFTAWVRFALFDPAKPTALISTLSPYNYDDSQPAGSEPSALVASVASATLGINTSDLSIPQTWAQNVVIHNVRVDTNVLLSDITVSKNSTGATNDPTNGAMVLMDSSASSGLGTLTGLPVVAVRFVVATNGDRIKQPFNVDIAFEIRHSERR